MKSRALESVQCFDDNQGVAQVNTKFRSNNDAELLLCKGLEVGIANISGPHVKLI